MTDTPTARVAGPLDVPCPYERCNAAPNAPCGGPIDGPAFGGGYHAHRWRLAANITQRLAHIAAANPTYDQAVDRVAADLEPGYCHDLFRCYADQPNDILTERPAIHPDDHRRLELWLRLLAAAVTTCDDVECRPAATARAAYDATEHLLGDAP